MTKTAKITTRKAGRNFGAYATVHEGRRQVHSTETYPTVQAARAAAETWAVKHDYTIVA